MNPFHTFPQLQPKLAARYASFIRHHNYGYASSQELTQRTHQFGFRFCGNM